MPEALPELIPLALLLVAFGLVYVVRKFVQALFNPIIAAVGQVPYLGGAIAGALHSIESAISRALGSAEQAIDHLIGAGWHLLAKQATWLWDTVRAHAGLLEQLALGIVPLRLGLHALRHGLTDLTRGSHSIGHRIKTLEREFVGIEHGVKSFEHRVDHVVNKDVLPHLTTLDKELAHVEGVVIPDIRAIANGATAEVTALEKWVKNNALLAGTTAFVAAVSWALARLGLGGLRCSNFGNLLNRFGCGLGRLLEDLLGLAISALALENVCTLLPILEAAFGEVVGPIIHLLTEVPLGGCETPPKGWARLSVATGPLPPAQTLGALPV